MSQKKTTKNDERNDDRQKDMCNSEDLTKDREYTGV